MSELAIFSMFQMWILMNFTLAFFDVRIRILSLIILPSKLIKTYSFKRKGYYYHYFSNNQKLYKMHENRQLFSIQYKPGYYIFNFLIKVIIWKSRINLVDNCTYSNDQCYVFITLIKLTIVPKWVWQFFEWEKCLMK